MDGGRHAVGLVLVRKVGHVDGVEVGDVVHVLLARQRRQRVAQRVEPLADVRVHVHVDAAHLPQHVQRPGASTAALCQSWEKKSYETNRN